MAPKTLVTSALPYANGPIHIGHLVEYVQTDIYVRFLRSCGEDVVYLCADDTHGTPIELNAAKNGVTPEQFIARFHAEHQKDFADFDVKFDAFGSTNSAENKKYAELIYGRLKDAGDIDRRDIEQTYCEKDKRFLPDRFVRGTCPNCKSPDQYGDVCEKCGKTYSPTDLIDPKCAICGTTPVRKKSAHLFFKLSKHAGFLKDLISRPEFLNSGIAKQLGTFFEQGLSDWDISRDGPYFGFAIPGETDKFFYVWLDAPIGYVATTEQYVKAAGKGNGLGDAFGYWAKDSGARIVHFIGKDIVYFHALFWPAVLNVAGFHLPDRLVVHGHLTVNGEKMSKTRGTLVPARTYLDVLDPSYLRYFYAANLGPNPEDLDLSLNDFRLRVNGELVNNIGNLANRSISLLAGQLGGTLAQAGEGAGRKLVEEAIAKAAEVRSAFENLEYRQAVKLIAEISQSANQFLQNAAPWKAAKTDPETARRDLSDAAEVAYLVAGLLSPVVPRVSERIFRQLNAKPLTFQTIAGARYPLLDRAQKIGTPEVPIDRLDEERVNALLKDATPSATATAAPAGAAKKEGKVKTEKAPAAAQAQAGQPGATQPATQASPGAGGTTAPEAAAGGEIEYADFAKVALKVGKILTAERIPKADKLLKLTVDVGEGTPRTIGAGIAEAYGDKLETLVGRHVVVVANLKPRTMRGFESKGMLLASGPGGKDLALVDPGPLTPGSEVK